MSRDTFDLLCHHLQGSLMKQDTHLCKAIPVNKRIAITLTRLAKNSDLSCISNTFGVGVSTVCTIYIKVCKAICQILTPIYLMKPTTSEMLNIIKAFEEKWGFPQCGGAIDGCHIPIISPSTYPADYYNRKGWHSVLLQGLVDHRYRFIDFDLGWPGKCHDTWVYEHSSIGHTDSEGNYYPELVKNINNVPIPVVLVGDSAYALSNGMMKPYKRENLTREQKRYNYIQSRSRMVVENAFGRLKNRWRCLMKRNDSSITNMKYIIGACLVLHNFCEAWGDNSLPDDEEEDDFTQPDTEPTNNAGDANTIRDTICTYISQALYCNIFLKHFIDVGHYYIKCKLYMHLQNNGRK
ncbi:protein ALP1-like [Anneissia japonica]|uniref:protein ALP1-like n=1 Tax=Anneissia japonica TaxID=1529436 RepID=UPI0014254F6D|nr:protein ALP1-like [Anneissia japonica]